MNLLAIGGDSSVARGIDGAHYQMLRHYATHWDRIDIITPGGAGAEERTVYGNVHTHPCPWPKAMLPAFIVRKGRELLRQRHYDLITSHDYGFFYTGVGTWLLTRGQDVPYVSELHHVEGYPRAATRKEHLYRAIAMRYIPFAAKYAAAFRVVNRVEMPGLLQSLGIPNDKMLILPSLYMNYDAFRPMPEVPKTWDALFVGRLAPNKGLFTILDAVAQVKQTHPNVSLAIRGEGALRGALEARIEALAITDHVEWLPRLENPDDVAQLYNRVRMVICASTAEGGPRVPVEAMACGTPVITTPVGMMHELIKDGETGLMFNWESGQLSAQMIRLLDDAALWEKLSANGREAVQGYDASEVIARYAQGYKELIQRR